MEQSPKPEKQQLYAKYKAEILLVGGTILAAGLGAFFQWANYQYDHHDRHKHEQEVMSYELFNSLSVTMGTRLFQMRRCVWALTYKLDPEVFNERYQLYQETLVDWNYQLQRNHARIKYCFGEEMRETFVNEIQADFRILNTYIVEKRDLAKAEALGEKLFDKINEFDFEMMELTWKPHKKDEH